MTGPRGARRPGTLPGASVRPGEGDGASEPEARPRQSARERALRLLAVRARSRRELETRLLRAGFEEVEVSEVVEALEGVGLVNDERLARELVEHAVGVKRAGRRAVLGALRSRGVPPELAELAVAEVGGDEEARAVELARVRLRRLEGLDRAVASRRLLGFLVRRGYDSTVARAATARALDLADPAD